MHLVDGLLSTPVLAVGTTLAAGGVAVGLKSLDPERLPQAAMASAVFFVASLVHVPVGPSSVHLLMSGLAGLVLGWAAFPALLVALALQAAFFGFGGLTALGVNTLLMAGPAVIAGMLARPLLKRGKAAAAGAVAGATAIVLGAVTCGVLLGASGEAFLPIARSLVLLHLPVAAIEAVVTAAALSFLLRVRPESLPAAARAGA